MAITDKVLAPFTIKGFYLLTWGTALGTQVWQTASSFRAYQTLPRTTFGTLQSRLTPLYFSTTSALTSTLLLTHLYFHPSLISSPLAKPHWWGSEEGFQGLLILTALVPSLANWLLVGPKATEAMFERHRLERLEGKQHDDVNPSDAMDKVNKKFSALHATSSSLNLVSFLGLVGLGLAVSM